MENLKDVTERVSEVSKVCGRLESATQLTESLMNELHQRLNLVLPNRPVSVDKEAGKTVHEFSTPLAIQLSENVSRVECTNQFLQRIIKDIEL